jgi:PhnB protein
MPIQVQPYLFFNGNCEEALEFYKSTVGATVDFMMRYKESPQLDKTMPPNFDDKVMHVTFRIGDSTLMAADDCMSQRKFDGFSLSLSGANEAEAKKFFDALSAGGRVDMPLTKTFWSPCFGMLTDKFGIGWMVSVAGEKG